MTWQQLRRPALCAWGCELEARAWAVVGRLGRRYYGRRFVVCERHAESHYGLRRPPVDVTQVRDGKALAVGDDE